MRVSASVKKFAATAKSFAVRAWFVLFAQTHVINSVKADCKSY